jgi:hypothetical protein
VVKGSTDASGDRVNINLHNAGGMGPSYVPRESEDQLQAPHKVPMVPHGTASSTAAFQSASSSVRLKLEQVDPGSGGGPNRRPGRWSERLPTSHLLVRPLVWGRPKQHARTTLRGCYSGPLCPRLADGQCLSGRSWFHDLHSLAARDGRTGASEADLANCAIS